MTLVLSLLSNPYFWIVFILLILLSIVNKLLKSKGKIKYPYIAASLLTKNELNFYYSLKPIAKKYGLEVFTKVRLADVGNVEKGLNSGEFQSAFNRIQSKHIDFLLTDGALTTRCAIELDDSSHDRERAKKNDDFKNKFFEVIKIPLIRTRNTDGLEQRIQHAISSHK